MRDGLGEEEVERSPAALAGDVLDDAREAVAADEERERLVLVRRPGHQLVHEERRCRERDRADPEPERVSRDERAEAAADDVEWGEVSACSVIGLRPSSSLVDSPPDADLRVPLPERAHLRAVPEDERRPCREVRDVWGGPVEKVLFPVAVHYKGSGFYSTDYGRGSRKATGKEGDGGSE